MNIARCRIGKVKFKSGGSLHLMRPSPPEYAATIQEYIDGWSRQFAEDIPDPVGFFVIVWGRDGAYCIHDFFSDASPITRSMGPEFLAECLRRRTSLVDNNE